ncbi:MAG: hypothetical protein FJ284_05205 [Planctomycetes bacterium]|nr:hypothetical protein [Planctomycetota bacterium]
MRERWRPATLVAALATSALADDEISYSHDVRPIPVEFCWRCHGASAADRRSRLRLEDRTGATASAASGKPAIEPGRPEVSQLWLRVQSTDPHVQMLPPESGRQPSPRQLDVLARWIAAGAPYEGHWAWLIRSTGSSRGPRRMSGDGVWVATNTRQQTSPAKNTGSAGQRARVHEDQVGAV